MTEYEVASLTISGLSLLTVVAALLGLWASRQQVKASKQQVEAAQEQMKATQAQLEVALEQYRDDHERGRREKAVALLEHCDAHQTREQALARSVIEQLDEQQVSTLVGQGKLALPESMKSQISRILSADISPQCANGRLELNETQTGELRWRGVQYLNLLETVLTAWLHNVADRHILEGQFRYLYRSTTEDGAMLRFRRALGKDNYPALDAFIRHLRETLNPEVAALPPTGKAAVLQKGRQNVQSSS